MNKPSRTLRRLSVASLGFATFGAAFAAVPASAATADITGLTISPTAAATSTGANTCQNYTVKETGSTSGSSTISVNLQPTGAIDSEFCGSNAPNHPDSGDGGGALDTADFSSSTDTFSFGVKSADPTPSTGSVQITAFPNNATGTPGTVSATATQTFSTGASQASLVTALTATPANQTATEGDSGVTYVVHATDGDNVVAGVTGVTGKITSTQGNPTGAPVNCGAQTNANGNVTCTATAPTSSPVQSGPYKVTFTLATGATTSVTTSATLTTAPAAAANAKVALTCGSASTNRTANNACDDPSTATSETFKAVATTPATTTGGAPVPAVGIIVTFTTSEGTVSPDSCVTDADGACTTTLTFPTGVVQDDTFKVTGTLSNDASDSASVKIDNAFAGAATNIAVAAASPTAETDSSDIVTASVTNQFGNASGANTQVFFTVTGGTFAGGTTSQTVPTDLTGKAQASVTSTTDGTATVTGTLLPGATTPNCSSVADPSTGAAAGNCTASTTVTFSSGSSGLIVEKPKLKVAKAGVGHLRFTVITRPAVAHKKVHFYKVKASGHHKLLGSAKTDASGVATKTLKLKKGKTYELDARVSLGSKYKSKYSASHTKKVKK